MNEDFLICYIVIFSFLIIRLKYYGILQCLQTIFSIFILITVGTLIFLVYDTWLTNYISEESIKDVINETYTDINNITNLFKTKNVKEPEFPQDEKDKKENNNLIRNSLLVGFIPLFFIVGVLYHVDKDFYDNTYKNLLSIGIIYIIELYFSWAIISDFKGEGLEDIRHEIISKLKNK